ncbi:MAG: hypothetical protein M0R51_09040, partial [Clostridia bacterium]|nr:hypothetical protein [Clostridia bacterium]
MPKKQNGSGGLQEYVPAGHGDKSGEFLAENGSHEKFKKFERPLSEMSGYVDYSMSVNAALARQEGMKPISQWSKSEILNSIKTLIDKKEINLAKDLSLKIISQMPLSDLKQYFLVSNEWHHTSSKFNKTDFYEINIEVLESGFEPSVADYNIVNNRIKFKKDFYKGLYEFKKKDKDWLRQFVEKDKDRVFKEINNPKLWEYYK